MKQIALFLVKAKAETACGGIKKTALLLIILISGCVSNRQISGQSSSRQFTFENALNSAIEEIAAKPAIAGSLAVVSITSLSNELTSQIIRLLENRLVNTKNLKLVTRQRIETILAEQKFGLSGWVDDNTAQGIGHILGADYVLTGDLIKPENQYFLNIQIIETETGLLVYSNSFAIKNNELKRYNQLRNEKTMEVNSPPMRF
ncbi:MAG: CsgG/HfaB family protein [Spirochaetaceae bacterium]|jgi:TolB-like protein|nr:CsgG/HfaB family protein [Spirochaetaceae bacterium]